jgi:ABC-2 type transport system ATP-binding protein
MSVTLHHVSKLFGRQKAVNDISFSVRPGEIVGFLGPNGAGKSTTMKMLTGFVPPSEGRITVAGYSAYDELHQVRQRIGYLPEHNPLYLDMYVHEFLRFVGKMYGLTGKELDHRVSEMIECCGLTQEQNKQIESLSKGYRQRVGLAQAFIHRPEVLILDEPTTGLDPNQIVEIRQLIKTMSAEKTVIFSTHIMQEVQALCDRVIVIHQGSIVADNRLEDLLRFGKAEPSYRVEFETPVRKDDLLSIDGVLRVEEMSPLQFRIGAAAGTDIRPAVFRFAADKQLSLVGMRQEENSLETIFKELTQTPA